MFIFEKNPKNFKKPVEITPFDGTVPIIPSILYSPHHSLHSIQSPSFPVFYTVPIIPSILYSPHHSLYSIQSPSFPLFYAVPIIPSIPSILYSPHHSHHCNNHHHSLYPVLSAHPHIIFIIMQCIILVNIIVIIFFLFVAVHVAHSSLSWLSIPVVVTALGDYGMRFSNSVFFI